MIGNELPKIAPGECLYNHGVRCGSKDDCGKCGWNPAVAEGRKRRREEENNQEGKSRT